MAEREWLGRQGRDTEAGSRGHTPGARRQARHARRKEEWAGADTGRAKEHAVGAAEGGKRPQTGTTHRPQIDAMPMTSIELYQPPRLTIRELMKGRLAGADNAGFTPNGYLGGPPKSAYQTEDQGRQRDAPGRARYSPGGERSTAAPTGLARSRGRVRGTERGEGGARSREGVMQGSGDCLAWPGTATVEAPRGGEE